jgi:hypothetical protein
MFQACVKMKPSSSILKHSFPCFKLVCKNETIPILPLVIAIFISLFFPDEPWFFHSIVTISLADHTLSLGCFTLS